MTIQRKAVALISGGLDSMLAAKLILDQGIHVEGLNFYTGFCHSGHTSAIRKSKQGKVKRNDALWVAEQLGIKLYIVDAVTEYQDVLMDPKFGYGQNLNPCLDCKIFMVKKAQQWMAAQGFDFIITGEVMGQRPKSQRKETMPIVAKQSGAEGRLLRPLCAKHLPVTLPESEGWVQREKLLDFHGRNRKPQLALAEQFAFKDYAQPAGGCCVLTDESYSRKLGDLWRSRGCKKYTLDDIILLKVGRHIRPKRHYKLIVARDEGESNFLEGYRKQSIHLRMMSHTGPLILVEGQPSADDLRQAAAIGARFSSGKAADEVSVKIIHPEGTSQVVHVKPLAASALPEAWYI